MPSFPRTAAQSISVSPALKQMCVTGPPSSCRTPPAVSACQMRVHNRALSLRICGTQDLMWVLGGLLHLAVRVERKQHRPDLEFSCRRACKGETTRRCL